MSKKYPECHVCGAQLAEAWRLKRTNNDSLYLCDDCLSLINAVAHDNAVTVFAEIAAMLQGQ